MENWQTVLFQSMRGDLSEYIVSVYYIAWIFLGNFILLNLFLAILLDSFLEEEEESEDGDDHDDYMRAKKARAEQKKKRMETNMVFMTD